jgi:hypothetical protein
VAALVEVFVEMEHPHMLDDALLGIVAVGDFVVGDVTNRRSRRLVDFAQQKVA